MKKKVYGAKLSRGRSARMALRRSLIRALVLNGKIVTTKSKVKFVQRDVEKLVSDSIKADVAKRRAVYAFLANDRKISDRLFEIANGFSSRSSGFTRTTLLPRRRGDNAEMASLEWSEKVSIRQAGKSDKSKKKEPGKAGGKPDAKTKGIKKVSDKSKKNKK